MILGCGKVGHIAPVCWSKERGKPTKEQPSYPTGDRKIKNVYEDTEDDDDYLLNNIRPKPGKPLVMDFKLNGNPLTMELDTGAAVSLVSEDTYRNLLSDCSLKPYQLTLWTYLGERMKVVGQLDVTVEYSTQQAVLPLYVVESAGLSLFGRNWLTSIRPEWESIKTMQRCWSSTNQCLRRGWES